METLSLRDAAQLTGCNPSDLLRSIRSGRLAAIRTGHDGPVELRVTRTDLVRAGLLTREAAEASAPEPAAEAPVSRALSTVPEHEIAAPSDHAGEAVPGLLYRELLMKHEQLLVQYGMVRVGGARLFEYKAEAEQTRTELDGVRRELRELEDRHHALVSELQAAQRKLELRLQERDEELRAARARLKHGELAARNAAATESVDRKFAEVVDKERAVEGLLQGRMRRSRRFPSDH